MKEKTIFIFEAEEGMILSRDVVLPDGHLIAPADTSLTYDIIERISDYHILEIIIEAEPRVNEDFQADGTPTYFAKIRQTKAFKEFNKDYLDNISGIKDHLNQIITSSAPIDTEALIEGTLALLSQNKNSLHLFDMLHSMREYDDITFVHSLNVALISSILGQWLGFSKEQIKKLVLCGLLHDIGKLLIPAEILSKPEKLTSGEFDIIKTHVNLGYDKLNEQNFDVQIKESCLFHHERCDGSGYPFGVKGDKIPVTAKIISIADVYDAMTSNRVYRGSICPFEVIRNMESAAFSQFDPNYLLPFLNNVVSSYLHTNVKLSNGLVGEVIMINPNSLSKPIVKCGDEFIDLSKHSKLKIEVIL